MESVNSETFKSILELAEIQKQIAVGQAELASFESTKISFFKEREAETLKIVDNALTMSREAIQEATSNKEAIASLLTALIESIDEIKSLHAGVASLVKDYALATVATGGAIKEKTTELEFASAVLKKQKSQLNDDQRELNIKKALLDRDRIRIDDTTEMLKIEINRINNLKI